MKIVGINCEYKSKYSSGIGHISCTYGKLLKLFGDPKRVLSLKTDQEWTLNFENGDHINIYDWKVGKSYLYEDGLDPEDITEWNVGGSNSSLLSVLKDLISDDWGGFEIERLKLFMTKELAEECLNRE